MSEESRKAFEAACAEQDAHASYRRRCTDAIDNHLGGKPELVAELVTCLRICQRALREPLDGWKGIHERTALDAIRALLSRIKDPSNE